MTKTMTVQQMMDRLSQYPSTWLIGYIDYGVWDEEDRYVGMSSYVSRVVTATHSQEVEYGVQLVIVSED